MPDDRSLPLDHEPLNRAERRAAKFRKRAGQPDPHAVTAPAPAEDSAPAGDGDTGTDTGQSQPEGSEPAATPRA
jgi:hypothetical protein